MVLHLAEISNVELGSVCTNGFKGVYAGVTIEEGDMVVFKHELGTINCTISVQDIVNTILKLDLDKKQKETLLENVVFIEETATDIVKNLKETIVADKLDQVMSLLGEIGALNETNIGFTIFTAL